MEIFEGGFEKSKQTALKAFLRRSLAHKLKSSLPQAEQDVKQALLLEPTSSEAINLEQEIKALTEYGGVKKVFLEDFEKKMGGKKKLIDEFLLKMEENLAYIKTKSFEGLEKDEFNGKTGKIDIEVKKNEDITTLEGERKDEGKKEAKQEEEDKKELKAKEKHIDIEDEEVLAQSQKNHLEELTGEVARLMSKHKEAKTYFRERAGLAKILAILNLEANEEISKILQPLLALLCNYLSDDVIAIEELISQSGLKTLTKKLNTLLSCALHQPIYYDHIIALTEVLINLTMQERPRTLLSLDTNIHNTLDQTLSHFSSKEPHAFSNLFLFLGNLCYQSSAFKAHLVSVKLHSFLSLLHVFPKGTQRKALLLQESYFNWLANVLTAEGVIEEFFGKEKYLEELGKGLAGIGKLVGSNFSFCEAVLGVAANLCFKLGREKEEKFGGFFGRVLDFAVLIVENADHKSANNKTLISRSLTILSRLTLLPTPSSTPPHSSYISFLKANFTTIKYFDQLGWKEGYANNALRVVGKLFTGERKWVIEMGLKPEKELMMSLMVNLSSEDEMRFCNR